MSAVDVLARAIRSVFRQQRAQAAADKERFGDWNHYLAEKIRDSVIALYFDAARSAKAKQEHADEFASIAKQRALEVARSVNATTGDWLQEGRELKDIFGVDRVVMIVATETNFARNAAVNVVAGEREVEWVNGKKPCEWCRKMRGQKRKAGKAFGMRDGTAIYHPPAHPFCDCKLRVV